MSRFTEERYDYIGKALFHSNEYGVRTGTALFEEIIEHLSIFISHYREMNTEVVRFPPVMSRQQLEKSGYLNSFPHLLGCVSCLDADELSIQTAPKGGNWADALSVSDLVLTPAACYPIYPLAADRGVIPADGLLFDVASYCFRRELTRELDRLQAFRMREYVCVGTGAQTTDFRERWMSRANNMADRLGLSYRMAPASDPFFGKVGKLAALLQVEQALKFELLVPVIAEEQPTACMSFNYHRDHFGTVWELRTETGQLAHTACVAFGLERLALALFSTHGIELQRWPESVRRALAI